MGQVGAPPDADLVPVGIAAAVGEMEDQQALLSVGRTGIGQRHIVVALGDHSAGIGAVQHLRGKGIPQAVAGIAVEALDRLRRDRGLGRVALAGDHRVPAGHREAATTARQGGDRLPHSLSWLATDPELVGIAVDHPVGPVLLGGEAGHARHPAGLLIGVGRLVDQPGQTAGHGFGGDRRGGVPRTVVGDQKKVDSLGQVMLQVDGQQVGLVAHQQGHHQLHGRGSSVIGASGGLTPAR